MTGQTPPHDGGASVPVNPVDVEQAILEKANHIARGVRIVSDAHRAFKDAERAYLLAYARAFMAYQGPAHSKRYAADVATEAERTALDAAEVAYRHADRQAKALEAELSALQSVMRSVNGMYGATRG